MHLILNETPGCLSPLSHVLEFVNFTHPYQPCPFSEASKSSSKSFTWLSGNLILLVFLHSRYLLVPSYPSTSECPSTPKVHALAAFPSTPGIMDTTLNPSANYTWGVHFVIFFLFSKYIQNLTLLWLSNSRYRGFFLKSILLDISLFVTFSLKFSHCTPFALPPPTCLDINTIPVLLYFFLCNLLANFPHHFSFPILLFYFHEKISASYSFNFYFIHISQNVCITMMVTGVILGGIWMNTSILTVMILFLYVFDKT